MNFRSLEEIREKDTRELLKIVLENKFADAFISPAVRYRDKPARFYFSTPAGIWVSPSPKSRPVWSRRLLLVLSLSTRNKPPRRRKADLFARIKIGLICKEKKIVFI